MGSTAMVTRRSLRVSILLVDRMAGTEQPNPSRRGAKLLPFSPMIFMMRLIRRETLIMYPLFSRTVMAPKRRTTLGRKASTPPTPPTTPSPSRDCRRGHGSSMRLAQTLNSWVPVWMSLTRGSPIAKLRKKII